MRLSPNVLAGKRKYLIGSMLLIIVSVCCVAFNVGGDSNYDISRREILLRKIGHEVLLQSGDSTTALPPIEKISQNEFLIHFADELTFHPDSLVNTTSQLLAQETHAPDYIVTVLNCTNSSTAYGYAISKNKKDDIVSCQGRKQPKACYMINIKFKPTGLMTARNGYLLGSIPVLAFLGFIFFKSIKTRKEEKRVTTHPDMISLGDVLFDAKEKKLFKDGQSIDLTGTEKRLLHIFALSPNEIIERTRLQKEIWEDEGVIVGRSLDMFISKLRKKLEVDPNIRIVVIRGKGYKLEIQNS
jgi:hypothetical protein